METAQIECPRPLTGTYHNTKDNVKVVIRVRPLNEREKSGGGHRLCVSVENDSSIAIEGYKSFNFDYVAAEQVDQNVIFQQIAKPIADCCLEGYNGSIFAYGQTGSGKTYTIQGPSQLVNGEELIFGSRKRSLSDNQRGLMQRSFEYIFEVLEEEKLKAENSGDSYQFEFLIRCSYLEIYNEQIMDLLEPSSVNLHIREDIKKGVYVEGLLEEVVVSAEDMIGLIQQGAKNRHVGSHAMNKESSRSHSVLTTIIETKSMKEGGGVWNIKTSRFHIIDLAGSERSKQTNAVGERLKEAGMINKSLSALGNVINSLVDISEGKSRHVHYRDSKLTFLLRDSLGGNSKTLIIANVSPSSSCNGETLSTLKFAQRAKLIKNKAVINEDSSGTIQILKAEIGRLKKELAENEKVMKALGNGVLGDCARCKAMFEGLEDGALDEDEMLISFDEESHERSTDSPSIKKKRQLLHKQEVVVLRNRVAHLEGLLSANLDTLSTQQRHYEGEIAKLQLQNKRIQQTVESYEKQSARDKMIIKFREERINKLETAPGQGDQDKLIADLRKEVLLWKEATDHNTQAAKLFAEKSDLQNKVEMLKGELAQSPESLSAQIHSLTELNESLNQYLKQYCEESQKELESEVTRVRNELEEQVASYQRKLQDAASAEQEFKRLLVEAEKKELDTIAKFTSQIKTMEERFSEDRNELVRINNEALAQIKSESCESLNEHQSLVHSLKLELIEKGIKLEEQANSKADMEKRHGESVQKLMQEISGLQCSQKQLKEQTNQLKEQRESIVQHHQVEKQSLIEQLSLAEERYNGLVTDFDALASSHESQREELISQYDEALSQKESVQQRLEIASNQLQEAEENKVKLEEDLKQVTVLLSEQREAKTSLEQQILNHRAKVRMLEIQAEQKLSEAKEAFEAHLKQLSEEKNDLSEEIVRLEARNHELASEAIGLREIFEKESSDIQAQFFKLEESLKKAEAKLKDQELRYQEQMDELHKEREIIMEEYMTALETERANNQQQVQALLEQLSMEKAKRREVVSENEGLKQRVDSFETGSHLELDEALNKVEQLQNELKSVQEDTRTQCGQFEQSLKIKEEEYRTKYEVDKTALLNLESELSKKLSLNRELSSQVELLNSQLHSMKQLKDHEIASFREEQAKLIAHFEEIVERLQIQRQQDDEDAAKLALEDREKLQKEFAKAYQTLIEAKDSEIGRLEEANRLIQHDFETKLKPLEETVATQTQFIEVLNTKQTELVQQLATKTNELQQHKINQAKFTAALSDSQHKLQSYHRDSTQLAEKLDKALVRNDSLLQEVERLQKQSQTESRRIQELESTLEDHEKHYQFMQDQMTLQLESVTEQYEAELQRVKEELETASQANAQCETLEEKLKQKEIEIDEAKSHFAKQVANLKDQLEEKLSQNEIENRLLSAEKRHSAMTESLMRTHQEQLAALEEKDAQTTQDVEAKKNDLNEQIALISKLKKVIQEHEDMLKACKETISMMRNREEQVERDVKEKQTQLQEREEKVKKNLKEAKDERERLMHESSALKELVRHKDRQLEEWLNAEERDKQALERISKENKDLRTQYQRQKFDMNDLAKKLKYYLEETARLKKDNEKLAKENDQLVGHKNPSQKIQHHVRIKEENNRLREENVKLQDEIRHYIELKHASVFREDDDESLVGFILSQQQLVRTLGVSREQLAQCSPQERNEIASSLVGNLVNLINERDQQLRDLEKDVKKFESLLTVSEKQRVISQQSQREMLQSPPPLMQIHSASQQSLMPMSVKNQLGKENLIQIKRQPKVSVEGLQAKKETLVQSKLIGHHVRGGSAKRIGVSAFLNK